MKKQILVILSALLLLIIVLILSSNVISNDNLIEYRKFGAIITIVGTVIIWIVLFIFLFKSEPKRVIVNMADCYKELSFEELKKIGINKNEFNELIYKKFVDIHTALANYDYAVLKENLTTDLYSYYVSELKKIKKRRYKRVMSDIELLKVKIYDINNDYTFPTIYAYLNVRMYDYLIDMDSLNCVYGSASEKVDLEFELIFEKRNLSYPYVMSKKVCVNRMNKPKNQNV